MENREVLGVKERELLETAEKLLDRYEEGKYYPETTPEDAAEAFFGLIQDYVWNPDVHTPNACVCSTKVVLVPEGRPSGTSKPTW